jgi:amino acid transporter
MIWFIINCVLEIEFDVFFYDNNLLGVGSTIGAGVYVLVGTVAREHSGPALAISFLIAGLAAGLSAFCYAELACRCPSAGSAYHYSYICLGEGYSFFPLFILVLLCHFPFGVCVFGLKSFVKLVLVCFVS